MPESEKESKDSHVDLLVEIEPVASARIQPKTSDVVHIAMTRAEHRGRSKS